MQKNQDGLFSWYWQMFMALHAGRQEKHQGATDPIDNFGAVGIRYVPLASGLEDCDTRVSWWPRILRRAN
jgi:hypothetical protein